jgi:ATP-dependent DNA ligase
MGAPRREILQELGKIPPGFAVSRIQTISARLPLSRESDNLRKLLCRRRSPILYLDHVENDGKRLFEQVVKMDLEGMVCKCKSSPYRATGKPSPHWIKVKSRRYNQAEGREELFEKR